MPSQLYQLGRRWAFDADSSETCPAKLRGQSIRLKASDDVSFLLSAEAACQSGNLQARLSAGLEEGEEVTLPFASTLLAKVVEYLKYHESIPPGEIRIPLQTDDLMDGGASKWDAAFVNVAATDLFNLGMAAGVLGISSLFLLTYAKLSIVFKDMDFKKLAKQLSILSDLPGEEEEGLREQFRQAFVRNWPRLPEEEKLLGNAALLQGVTAAAVKSGAMQATPGENSAVDVQSWRLTLWRYVVLWDWTLLREAPEEVCKDPDLIVAAASASQGQAFELAGEELRQDRAVVLEAVKSGGWRAFLYASEALQADRDFVLQCLLVDGGVLVGASAKLREDTSLVLEAAQRGCGAALGGAADALKRDESLVLEAAAADPVALSHSSMELQSDRDFAIKAAKTNGLTLQYMSSSFKADREIVSFAIAQNSAAAVHVHSSRRTEMGLEMPWDMKSGKSINVVEPSTQPQLVSMYQSGLPGAARHHRVGKHVQYSAGSTPTGNMGQGNYTAANIWLDKLPAYERPEIDSVTNMWGSVAGIGMRYKAFATMDIMLQQNTDNVITVEESMMVIQAMIVSYDPPEWANCQPMHPAAREGFLSISAGVVVGSPGGGWKPGRAETYEPPSATSRSGLPLARPGGEKKQKTESRNAGDPLGSWPGLLGADTGAELQTQRPAQLRTLIFEEGAHVILKDAGKKTGQSGTLVKKNGGGRWKVKLDSGAGLALLREEYLQLVVPPAATNDATGKAPSTPAPVASEAPDRAGSVLSRKSIGDCRPGLPKGVRRLRYHIAGTWRFWRPEEMYWDDSRQVYLFIFQLRDTCSESFYIVEEGSTSLCYHPPVHVEGTTGQAYTVEGPHAQQSCCGKYWTVGRDPLDDALPGDLYEIRLSLEGGSASKVEWSRLQHDAEKASAAPTQCDSIVSGEGWQTAGEIERKQRKAIHEARGFFVSRQKYGRSEDDVF